MPDMSPEEAKNLAAILGCSLFGNTEEVPVSEDTGDRSDSMSSAVGIPGLSLPKNTTVKAQSIHRRGKRWQCV
jgi:hypothetical protein